MSIKDKKAIVIKALSAIGALCCIGLYPPPVQNYAVALVERLKNDDINDVFWKQQMSAFATCCLACIVLLNLVLFTKKGREIFGGFCQALQKEFHFIAQNKKYFIFFLAAYALGYFTIIRGNFCYIAGDDLARQLIGCREWVNWYRYIDEFGSILIHTSPRLIDIAPLTQFIAIFFVALASFMTVQAATGQKMSYFSCIAALPVGLFPYFLTNMAYRFDSPYMALSVLAAAAPFAFRKERSNFIIASVIGILAMCTSYQAASGIYIVMTMLCVLRMLQDGERRSEIMRFIATALCCYVGALLFFHFTFMEREFKPGSIDERMRASNLPKNAAQYMSAIWSGLGKSSLKICVLLAAFLNLLLAALSKRGRALSLAATLLFYALGAPLSYGAYLAMGTPLWHSRAFMGIGFFVAAASLLLLENSAQKGKAFLAVSRVSVFAASYCCLAFAFAFGNAQAQQNEYAEFRSKLLLADLQKVIPDQSEYESTEILIVNPISYTPAVKNLIKVYPLTADCVNQYSEGGRDAQFILQSQGFFDFVSGQSHHLENENLPILAETAWHRISGKENHILVEFKETDYKVIKTRGFVNE